MHSLLTDIGVTVIAAALLGIASSLFKQPLLLALVAAGVLIGPELGLGLVHSAESIEVISELGLVLLLFIVGLEINLKELKKSGKQLLLSGLGQFPICVLAGLGFALLVAQLDLFPSGTKLEPLYLAVLCALSSTAIVVKLLYDKREMSTLPGKITLGVLVCQDIYAIFALALQPSLSSPSFSPIALALVSTVLLIGVVLLFSRSILGPLYHAVSMSPEIVISISLGWCAACAMVAQALGLSKEMGALIAGASISAFPYSTHVAARVLPLRDFFLTLFFVSLGMKIAAPSVEMIAPIVCIVTLVVVSRFVSIYPLVLAGGAGIRVAFLTSLYLAQMSEFSLVIAALGVEAGHVTEFFMSVAVYSMVLLAIVSSHTIKNSERLYGVFRKVFARNVLPEVNVSGVNEHGNELVILGFHRGARSFLKRVGELRPELLKRVIIVDFNPQRVQELRRDGLKAIFGDIGNFEVLKHIGLDESRIIVSIVPDMLLRGTDNCSIVRMTRAIAPKAIIVGTADDNTHEQELIREGAQIVIRPFDLAGEHMIDELNTLFSAAAPTENAVGITETLARRWTIEERDILQGKSGR